jgi:hypothetical protein
MERVNNLMVFDILPERKVVFLEHNINVQDTLSILDDKRISSAPVRPSALTLHLLFQIFASDLRFNVR